MKNRILATATVAAAILAGGTTAVAQSSNIQGLLDSLLSQARSSYVPNGWVPSRQPRASSLSQGGTDRYPLQINAGREYVFVGVCDADCSDLDLVVTDTRGNTLVQDVLVDDTPVVRYRATRTTAATLNVVMASCSQAPCFYQVATYAPRR